MTFLMRQNRPEPNASIDKQQELNCALKKRRGSDVLYLSLQQFGDEISRMLFFSSPPPPY